MKITSPAFLNNEYIPSKYTCEGDDINPPLEIGEVPEGTASLALIIDDPDAPAGNFVHWVVWNIDPKTTKIEEGKVPFGSVEGQNSFGRTSYGGPCPPSGTHRYVFKIYALNEKLHLDFSTSKEGLEEAMQGKILETAEMVGLYRKKQ